MKIWMPVLSIVLVISSPSLRASESDEDEIKAMVSFILDVETYRGMFYSVYDFCAPQTNKIIAELSQQQWNADNKELLAAQERAEQNYLTIMHKRGVGAEAASKLKEATKNTFVRAHDHNRLYKDLLPLEDKEIACSKRLGVMNSDSMSFKNIAPDSYSYWRSHHLTK